MPTTEVSISSGINPDFHLPGGQAEAHFSLLEELDGLPFDAFIPGSNLFEVDPQLLALADNGGPTQTHGFPFGSPALNSGNSALAGALTEDQRGFNRVFNGQIDMGAFERDLPDPVPIVVDTLADVVNGNFNPGDRSLREALAIDSGVDPLFIEFAPNLAGGTIQLQLGELVVDHPTTITGFASNRITIDAMGNSRVFFIDRADATLQGLRIVGGFVDGSGGGILTQFDSSHLRLIDSEVSSNQATAGIVYPGNYYYIDPNPYVNDGGGGISAGGALTLVRSVITNNHAIGQDADGGGIQMGGKRAFDDSFASAAKLTVVDSQITGNTAGNRGGGISARYAFNYVYYDPVLQYVNEVSYIRGSDIEISGSLISGNTAGSDGGGVFAYGSAVIERTEVFGNESSGSGGGIYAAELDSHQLAVSNNFAVASGGGIRTKEAKFGKHDR